MALITVSFASGFVGVNTGTNSSSPVYSYGELGWTNVQFTQNSPSNVFVAQGNDIIGTVLVTDVDGTEHAIPGFVKWRTPSGSSPSTMVFQPSAGATLDTDANGTYTSATYAIATTSYLGLTFNGQSLSFSEGGTVSGNAATSGLLDVLNDYLAAQPQLSVNDVAAGEGAGTVSFTVTLSAASADTVTVQYETHDGSAAAGSDYTALGTGTLTFMPGETTKTVVVTLTDDATGESAENFTVLLHDPSFSAIADDSGTATINDDDAAPGYTLGAVSGHTTEAGQTATFTVALATAPSQDVTVTVSSSDTTEGTVGPATLTFTAANWATPQTVTVTGVDDALVDGNVAFQANLSAASADGQYQGLAGNVAVTNDDDDTAALVVGAISRHTTEAGQTATFTVALSSQPTHDVTVSAGSGDATEGSAAPATLTFTSANWATPQTVTVTGVDDALDDGDLAYQVNLGSASTDNAYQGLTAQVSVINDDDDTAALVVGTVGGHTTEGGQATSFGVRLATQPAQDVTVTVASGDTTEGTVGPTTLTFTPANWNTPQAVTVTGVDDGLDDGNVNYQVNLASASTDPAYQGLGGQAAVTNDDDDEVALVLGALSGATSEAGQSASFSVRLGSQPAQPVTVAVASSDTGEGTVGSSTLTFTSANWATPQTVTVTGVNDFLDDDVQGYQVTLATSSADGAYQGLAGQVSVQNSDDDAAGLVLGAVSQQHTSENGGALAFTVRLASEPTAAVGIAVASGDTGEATAAPASLNFSAGNWNVPQVVLVTGVDDVVVDGPVPYDVSLLASSADAGYAGRAASVSLVNDDNDVAGLLIGSQGVLRTFESGGGARFSVSLANQPRAEVHVSMTSSNAGEGVAQPATLVFTPANWNTPQWVSVAGSDDDRVDGDVAYAVKLQSQSADAHYDGLRAEQQVVNQDNDRAALVLSRDRVQTSEAGTADSFTVRLASQPQAPVTVMLDDGPATEGRADRRTLTFTPEDWNRPQPVAVTGVDDARADGDAAYTLKLGTQSADATYQGLSAQLAGTNLDDDRGGLVFSPISRHTGEDGTDARFSVHLASQPQAPVTVAVTGLDATEGSVAPLSVVFTPDNWQQPQRLTVTGVDDALADGAVVHDVLLAASSADPTYEGQRGAVAVTNDDNDRAAVLVSSSALRTGEDGGSAAFSVRLATAPAAPVTVTISDSRAGEGRLSTTTLSFTPTNWATPQTVEVSGLDDDVVDGDVVHDLLLAATSADAGYQGERAAVAVTNADDDHAGLVLLAPDAPLRTGESGTAATAVLRLASRPAAPVTVAVASSDAGEGRPEATTLRFTPEDWATPQAIMLRGVDDELVDGEQAYALTLLAASADPAYQGATARLSAVNEDDDRIADNERPPFELPTDGGAAPGDTARVLDPAGRVIGTHPITPEDLATGRTVVLPGVLDDGPYVLRTQIVAPDGTLKLDTPVTLTVVTDLDGVQPSVELRARGGDGNADGVPDWQQPNVTQLPLASPEAFQAGTAAPEGTFGVVMLGTPGGAPAGAVVLEAGAQLSGLLVQAAAGELPATLRAMSGALTATASGRADAALADADAALPGRQARFVIDLPGGVDADAVMLRDAGGTWIDVRTGDKPGAGAALVDKDGDGRPERLVLTVTDGGAFDAAGSGDGRVGITVALGWQSETAPPPPPPPLPSAQPVFGVLLPGGDRALTPDPQQAARLAALPGARFEGAVFDQQDGGITMSGWLQPFTGDLHYGPDAAAMPYECYEATPAYGGFRAGAPGSGGESFHLYLDAAGRTQLATAAMAASWGLAAQGYRDLGPRFEAGRSIAFGFDAEGYLVANGARADVQALVQSLAGRFASSASEGFVDAVEQHYLAQVALVGIGAIDHGGDAGVAELNAAFGTHFGA